MIYPQKKSWPRRKFGWKNSWNESASNLHDRVSWLSHIETHKFIIWVAYKKVCTVLSVWRIFHLCGNHLTGCKGDGVNPFLVLISFPPCIGKLHIIIIWLISKQFMTCKCSAKFAETSWKRWHGALFYLDNGPWHPDNATYNGDIKRVPHSRTNLTKRSALMCSFECWYRGMHHLYLFT